VPTGDIGIDTNTSVGNGPPLEISTVQRNIHKFNNASTK